jgi:4-hydroxyphenylpyruvate dioxygenase
MLTIPTHVVPGALAEKLRAIAEVGFEAIDLSLIDVAQFDGPLDEIARLCAEANLKIASLAPIAPGATSAIISAKVKMAQSLGANLLILEVAGHVPVDLPGLEGVRVALRPSRGAEAAVKAFVDAYGDPAVGLALNAYHFLSDGSRPARFRNLYGAEVFHVALWDGPNVPMLPGQRTLNLGGFARVLARAGYDGPWSVGAATEGPDTVRNAYRSLVTILSDAA